MKKILIFLAVLILFSFTGLSCGGSKTTPEASPTETATPTLNQEPLVTADPLSYDAAITSVFEAADKEAKAWKANAELYMVSVKLPSDLSLNNAAQTYTYGSADESNWWWTYSYAEQTQKFVRALVYKADYLGATLTKPINKSFWRTNYIEAFQIADNYQGKDFRANNANTTVNLSLMMSEPKGWLWWLVEYKSPDGQSISVRINPNDRTIVDDLGEVVTTGSTFTPTETTSELTPTPTPTLTISP